VPAQTPMSTRGRRGVYAGGFQPSSLKNALASSFTSVSGTSLSMKSAMLALKAESSAKRSLKNFRRSASSSVTL